MQLVGQDGELFGLDVAHDVDQDGFFVAVKDGQDEALDGFFAARFQEDGYVLFLALGADDLFPGFAFQIGANGLYAINHLGAIVILEFNDVNAKRFNAAKHLRRFRLALVYKAGGY